MKLRLFKWIKQLRCHHENKVVAFEKEPALNGAVKRFGSPVDNCGFATMVTLCPDCGKYWVDNVIMSDYDYCGKWMRWKNKMTLFVMKVKLHYGEQTFSNHGKEITKMIKDALRENDNDFFNDLKKVSK